MASSKLPFSGPLKDPDFLESSPRARVPEELRSRDRLLPASWALAGGMALVLVSLGGTVTESALSVKEMSISHRTNLQIPEQMDTATRDLARDWNTYLEELRDLEIGPTMAKSVTAFWSQLDAALEQRPKIPLAGPTEQSSFIVVWDQGRHHFEVEFFVGERIEWFYRDRETEVILGGEGAVERAVEAARDYFDRVQAS